MGSGARERFVDSDLLQTGVGEIQSLEIREIGERDRALRRPTDHAIGTIVLAFDADAFGDRTVHDETIEFGLDGTGAAHLFGHSTDESRKSGTGDRRDGEIEFESVLGDRGSAGLGDRERVGDEIGA